MESATKLRILIISDGSEKANMTFPIYTLRHVESLMPDPVLEKLKQKNINLSQTMKKVEESGHIPQTIFEMQDVNKSYRVWIE